MILRPVEAPERCGGTCDPRVGLPEWGRGRLLKSALEVIRSPPEARLAERGRAAALETHPPTGRLPLPV